MSLSLSGIATSVATRAIDAVTSLLSITPRRSFATFSDFVSISESHNASVTPTQYPIEDGTQGTDHVIANPRELSWDLAFGSQSNPVATYAKLEELLLSGEPFDATTGLKTYENFILTSLSCTQDKTNSKILRVSLTMREIIITHAVVTVLPATAKQANPQKTATTANSGKKQLSQAGAAQSSQLTKRTSKLKQAANKIGGLF